MLQEMDGKLETALVKEFAQVVERSAAASIRGGTVSVTSAM